MADIFNDEKQLITDDPLRFIMHWLLHDCVKYNVYIKFFCFLLVLYIEVLNVLCFVDAIVNNNLALIKQYLPVMILQQPGALGYAFGISSVIKFFNFRKVIFRYCWTINSAGPNALRKIQKDRENLKSLCAFIFLMALFVHASFLPIIGDERHVMYGIRLIETNFGRWSNLLCSIYYFSMLTFGYGSVILVFISLYIIFHLKFQFYLINEILETLSDDFKLRDRICSDKNYQDNVYKRIILCVNQHVNIKLIAQTFSDITRLPLAVVTLVSSSVFVASAFFIISEISPNSNIRVCLASLACLTILGTLCTCGEMLAEESNKLYYLCILSPWTDWNKQNRQALSLLMTGCSMPLKITFYNLLDLNNSFILSIFRITYKLQALFLKYK